MNSPNKKTKSQEYIKKLISGLFFTILSLLILQGILVRFEQERALAAEASNSVVYTVATLADNLQERALSKSWEGLYRINGSDFGTIAVFSPKELALDGQKVTFSEGVFYLKGTVSITLNGTQLVLQDAEFLGSDESFAVFSGSVSVNGVSVEKNKKYNKGLITVLDRSVYKNTDLTRALTEQKLVPAAISDFSLPVLSEVDIAEGMVFVDKEVTVNGSVSKGSVTINGVVAEVREGKFSLNVTLNEGTNRMVFDVVDQWGNTLQEVKTVRYDPCAFDRCKPVVQAAPTVVTNTTPPVSQVQAPVPTTVRAESTSTCESALYQSQFLQILNEYRVVNGLNTLTLDTTLSLAACDHSKWMQETGEFSHTGALGSNPVERCQNRGVYCDGENLVVSYPVNTPQHMFDLYKASPSHNANMLGNHTVVGIAWAGVYQATVFR